MKMPREAAFQTRTLSIYSSMVKRFAEKKNKRGRIIRVGRLVPFTLADFRAWVLKDLGGSPDGTTNCRYCHTVLTAMDVNFDHPTPVVQGGDLGLPNLDACCDTCNKLKGSLSERTFLWLTEAMEYAGAGEEAMTELDRKDLECRLKGGGVFYRGNVKRVKAAEPVPQTAKLF